MNIVSNASNVEARRPSNDAFFMVPLSYKILGWPHDVSLTLLDDGA